MKDFKAVSKNLSREDREFIKFKKREDKKFRELRKTKRYAWSE